MRYKLLGNTGVEVSELCMGTMAFGGDADKKESAKMFNLCRDAGINIFDCANVYEKGLSETILGELIADSRNELIITSKVYFPMGEDINSRGGSRKHIMDAVHNSLKRLNTDFIDIYFLHRFDDYTPLEETLRALEDLVASGKILYLGASNFAAWQVAKGLGISSKNGWNRFECIQPMYNLVKRQAEVEILPLALSENLSVFSYSPLGGGLLTGKYAEGKRPEFSRLVKNKMYAERYRGPSLFNTSDALQELAKEEGLSPISLALAWVRSHPAITAPIIGGRSAKQLVPSLDSVNISLSNELRERISNLSATPPPATDRNEENTEFNYGQR